MLQINVDYVMNISEETQTNPHIIACLHPNIVKLGMQLR